MFEDSVLSIFFILEIIYNILIMLKVQIKIVSFVLLLISYYFVFLYFEYIKKNIYLTLFSKIVLYFFLYKILNIYILVF